MKRLLLLAAIVICPAFSFAQKDSVQTITLDPLEVTAHAGVPEYRTSAPRIWDIKHTRIALTFDYKSKTADAREWISLRPYFYPVDTLGLDAKGMRIDSVRLVEKKESTHLSYTYSNDRLVIHFNKTYAAKDSVLLYLKYTAMPYAQASGGGAAITDDRGLYFINTDNAIPHKPSQIWTQGETESNSHWMITIDKPNTRFTTQVELTVPDTMTTLSNGAMVKQTRGANKTRTDIWHMDMPIQAYVVMFAIGKFSVIKDHWKNKEVNYYVEQEYASSASLMFAHTPEMMDYFSQRTGVPFPWNKYSQVVVRDYVSGAMENTSAALFGEFMNEDARELADKNQEDVVSHELFHEWFGDYVTCESWSNITVNESFANYGEQLWRTHKYGKAYGDELAYEDLQIYIGSSTFNDPQLVRFRYDNREEVFDAISYNKGGAILHYLNSIIGDAAFDKAMNIYLTKNALHSAEAHNWRLAVEEATGLDWNWFFDQWYYHAGHPVLKVVYNYNDTTQKLMVTVSQTQSDTAFVYKLPLKAAVIYDNDKTVVDWNIKKRNDTFTYAYRNGVRPVVIPNYTHVLPGEVRDTKKPAQWLAQYVHSDDYISKRLCIDAAGRLISDSASQATITLALHDPLPAIVRYTLLAVKNLQSDKYHKKWTNTIEDIAKNDTSRLVRADALVALGSWKVKEAKPIMLSYLNNNSYAVSGAALEALSQIDKDTAYTIARQMVSTHPKASLENAIWTIIGKNGADADVALYEQHGPYILGQKKFSFALSLTTYLKNVKSDEAYRRGVMVYSMLVKNESMKSYRSALAGFMIQVAVDAKDDSKSDVKEQAASGKSRLVIIKPVLQDVVAAETDPESLKDEQKKVKEIFE